MTETSSIDESLFEASASRGQDVSTTTQAPESDISTREEMSLDAAPLIDEKTQEKEKTELSSESPDIDDYGNPVPKKDKVYTEAEVNERINKAVRERLARAERNQPTQQQVQQKTEQEFQYNAQSEQPWEQQLEAFVEQTVSKMTQKQLQQQNQAREQAMQREFETKFHAGMSKFPDFVDVVSAKPITDPMVLATRAMADPAAFVYAAAKRHPEELERISKIADPYTQMVEMGRLEERMKKTKSASQAPRPMSSTPDDETLSTHKEDREPTIEELIAQSEAKRLRQLRERRR